MWPQLIEQFQKAVPFVNTLGISVDEMGPGRAVATLTVRPEIANHLGTLHAGAAFTLAETASGCAMTGVFGVETFKLRAVAATSSISYKKLAKGTITATATSDTPAEDILKTLEDEGKVRFSVSVDVTDEGGDTCASVTVDWHVSPHR